MSGTASRSSTDNLDGMLTNDGAIFMEAYS